MVKNPPTNAGDTRDLGLIPVSGRSPGVGNDNPLQYSSLGNPMDRGAWWVTVQGIARVGLDLASKQYTYYLVTKNNNGTIYISWRLPINIITIKGLQSPAKKSF